MRGSICVSSPGVRLKGFGSGLRLCLSEVSIHEGGVCNDNDGSVCGSDSAFYKQSEGKERTSRPPEAILHGHRIGPELRRIQTCLQVIRRESVSSAAMAVLYIYIPFFQNWVESVYLKKV